WRPTLFPQGTRAGTLRQPSRSSGGFFPDPPRVVPTDLEAILPPDVGDYCDLLLYWPQGTVLAPRGLGRPPSVPRLFAPGVWARIAGVVLRDGFLRTGARHG